MKKSKGEEFYLGKYVYGEWLIPIHDYYVVRKMSECTFEVLIPFVISIIAAVIYYNFKLELKAVSELTELLPNILSIIIGFTITCISVLLFNSDEGLEFLKGEKIEERKINGESITLYQFLIIQYVYVLVKEIFFLLFIFFIRFMSPFISTRLSTGVILCILVYLTLNIFFIIMRSISTMYCMVFSKKNKKNMKNS